MGGIRHRAQGTRHRAWGYAVGGWRSASLEVGSQRSEDSEETLEVGGALRFRLEAEDRGRRSEV